MLIWNLRLPSFDKSARPSVGHQLVPADHFARMLDQGDYKVESATAKANLPAEVAVPEAGGNAERDRSLVTDDASNRPIELPFSELNLTVKGCRHPADLSRDVVATRSRLW